MLIIKKIVWNLLLLVKKIRYSFYQPERKNLIQSIPYYSQLNTGAKSKTLQKLWRKNGCGMACLQMILDHKMHKKIPLYELGNLSMKYYCFTLNPNNPDGLDGLFYKPFIKFLREEFNLDGKIISPLTFQEIIQYLLNKNYVIASVDSSIRSPQSKPTHKGGHLVLVTGFDWNKKNLYINNPSGNPKGNKQILFSDFEKFFASRVIILQSILA